jgi:hypothetical protein
VTLVIVPCGAKKWLVPFCAAKDLYVGSYFRAAWKAARALAGEEGTIRILSAKYGLISPEKTISPYNLRMGDPGCVTSEWVRVQAMADGLLYTQQPGLAVIVLAGRAYSRVALDVWPNALTPLADLHGMGYQLHRLRLIAERKEIA